VRIGVAATPEVAIPTLNWLIQSDHEVVRVITQPDRPAGRGRALHDSVVSRWAQQHTIPVLKPETPQELVGRIEDLDLLLTIGYGVLLPEKILSLPRYGFINLHFSLLPAYRGAAPAQRALQNGERTTGITVFKLDKGMDTGPIYATRSIAIDRAWRSFELLQQLAALGPLVVDETLTMISNGSEPTAQIGTASMAPKISRSEAMIDFTKDATTISNTIRAFTYEPGAWTSYKGQPFKIAAVRISDKKAGVPGHIVVDGKSVMVSTGHGSIELLRVIPAGKKEMDAIDWARGARLTGGELFG